MKKILLLTVIALEIVLMNGCSTNQTTVQIVRNPLFAFNFNSTSWKADTYSFGDVSKVVVYPANPAQPGQLFNRFTLQGTGRDSTGNTYQFIVTFDSADPNLLVGVYTPTYTAQRGLSQVQLFNLTNSSNLAAYQLCSDNLSSDFFQIQKQGQAEGLISGAFQMTLCNTRDTTQKINITNGVLKDIKY